MLLSQRSLECYANHFFHYAINNIAIFTGEPPNCYDCEPTGILLLLFDLSSINSMLRYNDSYYGDPPYYQDVFGSDPPFQSQLYVIKYSIKEYFDNSITFISNNKKAKAVNTGLAGYARISCFEWTKDQNNNYVERSYFYIDLDLNNDAECFLEDRYIRKDVLYVLKDFKLTFLSTYLNHLSIYDNTITFNLSPITGDINSLDYTYLKLPLITGNINSLDNTYSKLPLITGNINSLDNTYSKLPLITGDIHVSN